MIRRIEIDRSGGLTLLLGDNAFQEPGAGEGKRNSSAWYDFRSVPPLRIEPLNDPLIPLSKFLQRSPQDIKFKVLNYRPSRRLVVVQNDGREPTILKGYKRRRCDRHAQRFLLATRALEGGEICTPEILEINTEYEFIRMRRQPGHRPVLSSKTAGDFGLMGSGVRRLQSRGNVNRQVENFTREDELAVMDERVRRLKLAGGEPPDGWIKVRRLLAETVSEPAAAKKVLTHRDMHDGQWLLHQGQPCLLDFDLLCLAEPELDPANFLAHLTLRRLQHPNLISKEDEETCGQAFLKGLALPQDCGSSARLRFYQATTSARLALVYQLRPRWLNVVPQLLNLSHACLQELTNGKP